MIKRKEQERLCQRQSFLSFVRRSQALPVLLDDIHEFLDSVIVNDILEFADHIKMLYNIVPEAAVYLADRDIAQIAKTTEFNCKPDAICVSGLTAGSETDTQVLTKVKKATVKTPIFCNTGCNKDNIVRQLSASDGAVCATTFKVDGKFENVVDYNRVKEFMDIVKEYRKSL